MLSSPKVHYTEVDPRQLKLVLIYHLHSAETRVDLSKYKCTTFMPNEITHQQKKWRDQEANYAVVFGLQVSW